MEVILGVDGEAISGLKVSELREIVLLSINDFLVKGGFSVCKCELDWIRSEGGKEIGGHVGKATEWEDNQVVI